MRLIEVETEASRYRLSMIFPENRQPLFRIML